MDIGKRIEFLRKDKGVTQQQLADYLSVLPQTVSRWETGGTPDVSFLPKIALFFGISLDDLFGISNMQRVKDLVIRYSVLRDEKSFEDAENALSMELSRATEEGNTADRQELMAERMHLLLQKGWQSLKEAETIADQLIPETEDPDNPWHLPVRLQKMQFQIEGPNTAKYLRKAAETYKSDPSMESLQIYFWALVHSGQSSKVLEEAADGYAQQVLLEKNEDSLTVWGILFYAAAESEDISFFKDHFSEYESLTKELTGNDDCFYERFLFARTYAALGYVKEKEAFKERLLKGAECVENELMRERYIEDIKQM